MSGAKRGERVFHAIYGSGVALTDSRPETGGTLINFDLRAGHMCVETADLRVDGFAGDWKESNTAMTTVGKPGDRISAVLTRNLGTIEAVEVRAGRASATYAIRYDNGEYRPHVPALYVDVLSSPTSDDRTAELERMVNTALDKIARLDGELCALRQKYADDKRAAKALRDGPRSYDKRIASLEANVADRERALGSIYARIGFLEEESSRAEEVAEKPNRRLEGLSARTTALEHAYESRLREESAARNAAAPVSTVDAASDAIKAALRDAMAIEYQSLIDEGIAPHKAKDRAVSRGTKVATCTCRALYRIVNEFAPEESK